MGRTPAFYALMKGKLKVVQALEGDQYERRILITGSVLDDVPRNVLVYDDLTRCIRCDDSVTLLDGTVLDFKTAQIMSLEQRNCDVHARRDALVSLACVLRNGETITLGDGCALDARQCLEACMSLRFDVSTAPVDVKRVQQQAFLRLGIMMTDPCETIKVYTLLGDRWMNRQELLVEFLRSSPCLTHHKAAAFFRLGSRLVGDETVALYHRPSRRRDCFERALVLLDDV